MRLSRLTLVVLSVALVGQSVPVAAAPVRSSAPRIVDVRAIAKHPTRAPAVKNWLSPTRAATSISSSAPKAVEAATIFEGLSLAQNEQLYGPDQSVEPADAQVAASSSWLVEVAGNTMGVFGSDGSLQWTVDLQRLFQQPAGNFFYAASLQYDYVSGRWFLGGIASNTGAHLSWLLMAVSRSGNPIGQWSVTTTDTIGNNPSQCRTPCPNNDYFMRESIAVTGDKVVQAEQRVDCASGCNLNRPGMFLVMRKDQLLAGVQPTTDRFQLGPNQFDFLAIPPQSVGGAYGNIAFLAWLKVGGSSITNLTPDRLGLLQITGLPNASRISAFNGSTTVWETDFNLSLSGYSAPTQPGGNLSPAPSPLTSGVFRDDQVVLAINDNCSAGSPPQWSACIHLVKETDLASATPILNDRGSTGYTVPAPKNSFQDMPRYWFRDGGLVDGLFDASLAIDPYGNLFVSAAVSSPTRNPGMVVFGIRAPIDSVSWFTPVSPIVEGPSSYNCFTGGNNAWGAYMRAVPDPNNWTHVWMAGEVAVDSCWATAIVSATMGVGPQAATMSPAFGSTKGGRMVQIDGSFFVPDADQVFFGSNPGTIVAESPTAIIVTAPAGVAGSVAVTVQTPDGTASAGTFTYLTPGTVTAPPSSTGLHWR